MATQSPGLDLDAFRNPPASHRSMPLWVWNGDMSEARITEMLEQFAARGMGGVFVHPRPGLITEYLSDRWFELWGCALRECKRLGLECNIYDENSYPAGFAGGHVSARIPHASSQYVEAVVHKEAPARYEGQLLAAYRIRAPDRAALLPPNAKLDDALKDGPVLTLALRRASGSPWTAWFPMVDTTRPEVAREFIATTYEAYARRFGRDFGKTITAIFCDEPLVATVGAYSAAAGLPMSWFFLREFRSDHGYDLQEKLSDLFVDQEGAAATRFDYYKTLQRLWTTSFLKPLYEWCEAAGVRLTGHFMEQDWPYPYLSPSCMEGYRWLRMPGVDLLAPQFDFLHPERSAHYVMTFRELNSAANQLGAPRRLCETHGVGGYEATFEEFKRVSDWIMTHGINFINQHLSYQTISGARKYDHPQTFSDHSAWWDSYRVHADHVARLSVVLSQGAQRNRVLLLHSTTTGWIHANPAAAPGVMERLRASEGRLVQWLVDRQVDFDLGDELLMADFGRVNGVLLEVGQRGYSTVLLPEGMENWCASTLALVERYLAGGGVLLSLREPPPFVNGRPDPRPARLAKKFGGQWQHFTSLESLQEKLDQLAPPLITTADGGHLPALVGHQMRVLDDGDAVHFLANHGQTPVCVEARVTGAGLCELDTFSGDVTPMECRPDGTRLIAPLELPPAGHAVWLVSKKAPAEQRSKPATGSPRTIEIAGFERIERTAPNVLALDFCDLTLAGKTHRGLYVTRANRLCWQAHGFDQDPWDRAVQFRRNYFDFKFGAGSGFEVVYPFQIDRDALDGGCELALERPELYRVEVNGQPVSFENGRRWLDETIRAAEVGSLLQPGRNSVSLTASPFHIFCEIDRVYLLGNFAIEPSSPGFRIVSPAPLRSGDWTKQGLGHYPGGVRYAARVVLDAPARNCILETPQWAGSVINVSVDKKEAGHIAFPPYRLCLGELNAGAHEIVLEVVGTPKNLLGPHFCNEPRPGRWSGPWAWDMWPEHPADGADYEILPYGLLAPARLVAEPID